MYEKTSYRQIMKATSIFGGVQVINIIVGIIRSKFIAVLLGPLGMGISGLLTSTIGFIAVLTNFGLATSAVKDIAAAHDTGNEIRVATITNVFKRWVWITGLLGTILTAVLSPWLSQLTFGNKEYTWAFIVVSITLLINQISTGNGVLLQGMRKINYLAKSSILGSLMGLFSTIPLYYFFGIKGIVPAIITASFTTLILTWYFTKKLNVTKISVSNKITISEGKGMLKMGFMINISGLITLGSSYIVRIYIGNLGGIEQVGLYSAGFAIINSYVGMVFTAMGTDYYPRLSAVAYSNSESKIIINQQAEIALLILAPIIMIFLVFINWVIIILYSKQFIAVNEMILYAALGMFFKAATWSIGFIFLSKGASKVFFWSEVLSNSYLLLFNLIGYKYFGLIGMGMSFLISYFFSLIQVYIIAHIKYKFSFISGFYKIFAFQFLLAFGCFVAVKIIGSPYSYAVGLFFTFASLYFSYKELDKRLDVKSILIAMKNKF